MSHAHRPARNRIIRSAIRARLQAARHRLRSDAYRRQLAIVVGWVTSLVALVGVFVGGAGFVMLLAGHRSWAVFTLIGMFVVSLVYLAWFLERGPGKESVPSARGYRERRLEAVDGTYDASLGRSVSFRVCSFCGTWQRPGNSVISGDYGAVCESCAVLISRLMDSPSRWRRSREPFDAVDWWPEEEVDDPSPAEPTTGHQGKTPSLGGSFP